MMSMSKAEADIGHTRDSLPADENFWAEVIAVNEEINVMTSQNSRRGKTRRCSVLSEAIFRDNEASVGGNLKLKGEVVSHRLSIHTGEQLHVNCRVETFGLIVRGFDNKKVRWVEELGFGSLLYLRDKSLPRHMCYWLMSKVDPIRKVFVASPGVEYPLDRGQVRWVLGLPYGPNAVPDVGYGERFVAFKKDVLKRYGVKSKRGYEYVSLSGVIKQVEGECSDAGVFKTTFLALALGTVLCPSTCSRLGKDLIPALSVGDDAPMYDWCGLVMEKLLHYATEFAKKFYKKGYVFGAGGCTYFLAIFYLDRLKRPPVRWGMFPRIRAWDEADVESAKIADKLSDDAGSDYGKLEFVAVPYGHPHPMAAQDTMGPNSMALEIAKYILTGLGVVGDAGLSCGLVNVDGDHCEGRKDRNRGRKERRKGPKDGSNPYLRRIAKASKKNSLGLDPSVVEGTSIVGCKEAVVEDFNAEEKVSKEPRVIQHTDSGLKDGGDVDGGESIEYDNVDKESIDWETTVTNVVTNAGISDEVCPFMECSSTYMWGGMTSVHTEFTILGDDVSAESNPLKLTSRVTTGDVDGPGTVMHEDGVFVPELPSAELQFEEDNVCDREMDGEKLCRSRKRRVMKPSVTLMNSDFVVELYPRRNSQLKSKLIHYVCTVGAILKDEAGRPFHEKTQEDVILVQTGNMFATISNCYGVASSIPGGVDDNYVRAAASLYNIIWKRNFGDSGLRYMVDPTFAIRLLQESGPPNDWNDCRRLSKIYAKDFGGRTLNRVHVVFVPILENEHWWCVSVSLNTEELWIIDSASVNPLEQHQSFVSKLCEGLQILFSCVDPTWKGSLDQWDRKVLSMQLQADGNSCGVQMLLAVKGCAYRHLTSFTMHSDIEEERAWLLTEDLLDEGNEVKDKVKALVTNFVC